VGSKEQFQDDPEMAVILAAFNRQRCRRIQEQVLVETNVINFEHVVKISHERVPWRRQATSSWRLSSRACLSSTLNARPRWPPASKWGSPTQRSTPAEAAWAQRSTPDRGGRPRVSEAHALNAQPQQRILELNAQRQTEVAARE
jgi:hypothetical protein